MFSRCIEPRLGLSITWEALCGSCPISCRSSSSNASVKPPAVYRLGRQAVDVMEGAAGWTLPALTVWGWLAVAGIFKGEG